MRQGFSADLVGFFGRVPLPQNDGEKLVQFHTVILSAREGSHQDANSVGRLDGIPDRSRE